MQIRLELYAPLTIISQFLFTLNMLFINNKIFSLRSLPVEAKRTCPPVLWRRSRYRVPVECVAYSSGVGPEDRTGA